MKPTNELRFVKRQVTESVRHTIQGFVVTTGKEIQVLQQKWVDYEMSEEWRDVPAVEGEGV